MCKSIEVKNRKNIQHVLKIKKEMERLMREKRGVGIAAPQVGEQLRMFLAYVPKREGQKDEVITFINPVITGKSNNTFESHEGCLSIPGQNYVVQRPEWVKITYFDGVFYREALYTGGNAAIICHEYDHLDGITIRDNGTRYEPLPLTAHQ